MKTIMATCLALGSIGIFAMVKCAELPLAKFTVHVHDERGFSLPSVKVQGLFGYPYDSWRGGNQKMQTIVDATTDSKGEAVMESPSTSGLAVISKPDGYYESGIRVKVTEHHLGRWKPWNPTVNLVLRPILNPVKMYAKKVWDLQPPARDEPLGYDFTVGDWVAPYGVGKSTDVVFVQHTDKRWDNDWDSSLTVSFPKPGDGIQRFWIEEFKSSDFKSPRFAPENGYKPSYVITRSRRPGKMDTGNRGGSNDRHYFLRVRTVLGPNGEIRSANYVKIYGEFYHFQYFFNPNPNDRNMEYGGNLMTNLKDLDRPHGP